MTRCIFRILVIAAALLTGLSASAHHNPGVYFDMGAEVVHRDARVVEFTAANPHGRLVYAMADEDGVEREWVAELPANNMMRVTHVLLPGGEVATFYAPQGSGSPDDLE